MDNYKQDEINLYELWNVIVKRKLLFCLVFIIVLIVGITITISMLRHKHYQFTQAIKIATYYDNGNIITLQDPKTVTAKITALYLPIVLNQYNIQHINAPIYLHDNDFSVNNVGNDVIVISVKGVVKNKAAYREIFKSVLAHLVIEEMPLMQAIKNSLTAQLSRLNKELEFQVNFNKALSKKILNLEDVSLQHVILSQQQETYSDLTTSIAEVERNLGALYNSHFISDVTRSAKPVGISKLTLLMLFIIVAFISGLFVVFVVEFFVKAKKES